MLRLIFLIAFFITNSLLALSGTNEINSEKRSVEKFSGVSVSSGINLFISQKNFCELTVETSEKLMNKVMTRVESGILKVYMSDFSSINNLFSRTSVNVYVSMNEINRIESSAGADIVSNGLITADKIKLEAGSGSDIKLEINADEIHISSGSGSDITVWGKANNLYANASAGSDINANDLKVKKCIVSVSSGSDIRVNVSESIDANANSGGDIFYTGNPQKKSINNSSGGKIHKK